MININENTPKSSTSKVFGIILSLCLIVAAVVVTVKNGKTSNSSSLKSLISVPDNFTGKFSGKSHTDDYTINGMFKKSIDASGEWKIDAELRTNTAMRYKNETHSVSTYTTYTVLDNTVTVRTVDDKDDVFSTECLDQNMYVPYGRVKSSLEQAYNYEHEDLTESVQILIDNHCSEADYKIINFEENFIVVCGGITGKHSKVTIVAEDWIGTVTRTDDIFETNSAKKECQVFDPLTSFDNGTETRRTLTMMNPDKEWIFNDNHLHSRLLRDNGKPGGGKGGGLPSGTNAGATANSQCLFIHSMGGMFQNTGSHINWYSNFVNKWGQIKLFTPNCLTHSFIHTDAAQFAFNWEPRRTAIVKKLQCAKGTNSMSHLGRPVHPNLYEMRDIGTSVGDTIFSHGSGGLVWSFVRQSGQCNVMPGTTHITAGVPFDGYGVAGVSMLLCTVFRAVMFFSGYGLVWGIITSLFFMAIGLCYGIFPPAGLGRTNGMYVNRALTNRDISVKDSDHRMCGISRNAMNNSDTVMYGFISWWWTVSEPTDGFLQLSSCTKGATTTTGGQPYWGTAWAAKHYKIDSAHNALNCENGNHWTKITKKPCKWFAEVTGHSRGRFRNQSQTLYGLGTAAPVPTVNRHAGHSGNW